MSALKRLSATIEAIFWRRLDRWLLKRQTEQGADQFNHSTQFNHSNLLVFPSRYGFWFVLLLILLYLLGTNYQNNLVLLLTYLLLSVFLLSIWLAWKNVSGLRVELTTDQSTFAGCPLELQLDCTSQQAVCALDFCCEQQVATFNGTSGQCQLPLTATKRGCHPLPRIQLISYFPFGLIRCWSYLPSRGHYWVFPAPLQHHQHNGLNDADQNGQQHALQLPDQLKPYQSGDSIRHLYWKRLAIQPHAPVVKAAEQQATADPRWLVVPALTGPALEQALSEVCYQLLELEQAGIRYGLKTPTSRIEMGTGPLHLQQCLQRLASC
ncbi:MAG: DUF58 domain-containing protein [Alkalimonas sp.]|nr:DUF58 domain-containing protein [Alkalimonas sp.]